MLIAKVIYDVDSNNIYESIRKIFDNYSKVQIVVNNKIYKIVPGGKVEVQKFDIYDIKYKNSIIHDILVPSPFVYNKADRFIMRQEGKKFDYFGATLGQVFGLGFQDANAWYDAELVSRFFQYCLFDEFMELNSSKMSISKLFELTKNLETKQTINKQNSVSRKPNNIKQ